MQLAAAIVSTRIHRTQVLNPTEWRRIQSPHFRWERRSKPRNSLTPGKCLFSRARLVPAQRKNGFGWQVSRHGCRSERCGPSKVYRFAGARKLLPPAGGSLLIAFSGNLGSRYTTEPWTHSKMSNIWHSVLLGAVGCLGIGSGHAWRRIQRALQPPARLSVR